MKLPIKLPFQKPQNDQYYLSLLLSDDKTHATVFSEENGKITIVGQHEQHFHIPLEKLSDEQLLDILDKTISTAESKLPEGVQTRKTIFGVKQNWIVDTQIKKEYLSRLKKICDALGLTPIGFLVTHEAIAHLLQKEEGAPVSAILVEEGAHEIAVSILRAGKLLETKELVVEDSIAKTVDKALMHFTSYEILPSRIILCNAKNHEKLQHELTTHQWSKSLPFLHVPQTKILSNTYDTKALLFGAATQMGFEMVDKFDMPIIPSKGKELEPEDSEKTIQDEIDDFGFMQDKDIAAAEKQEKEEESLNQGDEETAGYDDQSIAQANQEFFASEETVDKPTHKKSLTTTLTTSLKHTQKKLAALFTKIPLGSLTDRFPMLSKRKGIVFIPPLIIGVLLLLFLGYIFMLKAVVTINIDPKTIEKTQDITFSTKQSTDIASNIIAIETVSVSEDGSDSTAATGKKEVGDKAKGSVTIYSRLSSSKTFSAGTVISGPNGLKFTLDKDITVASSSGDASASPSTSSGPVTASDIGKEANLPSGSKFTISGFSEGDAVAKNDSAFSGGSKKDITVISKADQAKLLDELPKQLTDKAKSDMAAKTSGDKAILPIFLTTTVDKKSFDKNVGDEASSVTLTATISFDSGAYAKSDIEKYSLSVLSSADSSLSPDRSTLSYTLSDVSQDSNDTKAKATVKGSLVPKLDTSTLAEQIAGKSFADAKEILSQSPQVKDADIVLQPALPFLPSLLPRLSHNITIDIKTNP